MPGIELVVIGGSAGGLPALLEVVRGLPPGLRAALCVVIHSSPYSPSKLPEIGQRQAKLRCVFAADNQPLAPGSIYFAPVDRHLLIHDGRLRVTHGPRENGFRPAVDPLFRTAARWYGPRAAGIILSGSLGDGSSGLAAIKRQGGIAIVQDPDEALIPSMPLSALRSAEIDHIVKASEMARVIQRLCVRPSQGGARMSRDRSSPGDPAEGGADLTVKPPDGELTPFTCPECGGSLWQQDDGGQMRFRCHVGHGYNGESLLEHHSHEVESALWMALRVLEEHAVLQERMGDRATVQKLQAAAEQFHGRARKCKEQAAALRKVLLGASGSSSVV